MFNPITTEITSRFTRSIHILRDFDDQFKHLEGYQVTPLVFQASKQIFAGLTETSVKRAFSLIGPYGSGKSAFGLFLAHYFQANIEQRIWLQQFLKIEANHAFDINFPSLLSVIVPGNNDSLRIAILQSLYKSLLKLQHHDISFTELCDELHRISYSNADEIDPETVTEFIQRSAHLVQSVSNFDGIFLIVDELGQYLDYVARENKQQDLFVLQSIAEMAARSANTPVLFITILHQAFERYSAHVGTTRRVEWAKVQGRFTDIPFQEPNSQMFRIIAKALRPISEQIDYEYRTQWAQQFTKYFEDINLIPHDIDNTDWVDILSDSYPLHPLCLIALPSLFRQFAQNERSLFAFLHSDEAWGFQDVLQSYTTTGELPVYTLTHLYNYIETNLGQGLFTQAKGQRWAELAEARIALKDEPFLLDILTVIGTIGAIERASGLRANKAQISLALTNKPYDYNVEEGLTQLLQKRSIVYRQYRDTYILWEGSDIDIENIWQTTRRDIDQRSNLQHLLQKHTNTTPKIANRHSYQTGAIRSFGIRYIEYQNIVEASSSLSQFDGEILYIIPTSQEELDNLVIWAQEKSQTSFTNRIIVLPHRVHEIRDLLIDVATLELMLQGIPELEHDKAARREIAGRLSEAQQALDKVMEANYHGQHGQWFYRGEQVNITNAWQLDDLLSQAADNTYYLSPRVWNELIVRRQPSAAVTKARRNLVEAMLEHADKPGLNIQGFPPERAIYESVLLAGGIHQKTEDNQWFIGAPPVDNPLNLRPVWDYLESILYEHNSQAYALDKLLAHLELPPYGVKAGLIPVLFMSLYIARSGEINLYERGNYVPMPDMATFERLLTRPEQFAVKLSSATGVRFQIYQRLAIALAPRALEKPNQPALLAVAMPLLRLFRSLPQYSKQTKNISNKSQAIRQALGEARSPDELLFELLPKACGLFPFTMDVKHDDALVDDFIRFLRNGLEELDTAYSKLLEQITKSIKKAFNLNEDTKLARNELERRFSYITNITNDKLIQGLGMRLELADKEGLAWIESIASLIARKPPENWVDTDLPSFHSAVLDLGRKFRNLEDVAITSQSIPSDAPVLRIGLASGDGEQSQVIHLEDNQAIQSLRADLHEAVLKYNQLTKEQQITAIATLLQELIASSDDQLEQSSF
jgi:hypothetical protein